MFLSATSFTVSPFCIENLLLCYGSNILLFLDFLPSYLFTALSSFSWACWIAPNNAKVNQLFGVNHGLAMGMLTFDWGQISFANNPLPTPWWVAANTGLCIAFFYWFLVPILYVRRNHFVFRLFTF
jgi:OPT oligopeptide transporter protein